MRYPGHAGVKTVEHVVEVLPRLIHTSLTSILTPDNGFTLSPSAVSDLLIKTITDFDRSILDDLLGLFPGGSDAINRLSDSEIDSIINDFDSGGTNHTKVLRCMQGSTVLVSLVDPEGLNLWVCSLGDCQAGEFQRAVFCAAASFVFRIVLGTKNSSGAWTSTLLSSNHNGHNNEEVTRIRQEHPEDERDKCVLDDRVFGVLAVTRGGQSTTHGQCAYIDHVVVS
jgi:pyruvate dehydrogenase phosphatase